jgi:hypothetical protein
MQCDLSHEKRIRTFQGSQGDTDFLSRIAVETAPDGFDIIIDDASHRAELTKMAFWHLFTRHLKPGGLYVIEDWGTGYWDDWPDGKSFEPQLPEQNCDIQRYFASHNYGMVGFIKQLVDEQGARALTRRKLTGEPERASLFESMMIVPSIVFIKKAGLSIH